MPRIIQITAVRFVAGESSGNQMDVEPVVLGLGDDGGVYRWSLQPAKWSLWGVGKSQSNYHPQSETSDLTIENQFVDMSQRDD